MTPSVVSRFSNICNMFVSDFFFKLMFQEYSEKKRAVNLPFWSDSEKPGTIHLLLPKMKGGNYGRPDN